jgi:hypothetical protein
VPDEALAAFMAHCNQRIGEAYFRTPRNTIKAFVQLLSILEQNPSAQWSEIIGSVSVDEDEPEIEQGGDADDDELASLTL